MKLMRLAMCVAVFALVGKIAMSEDLDVQALQSKLAQQEARLNDLQAKMNGGSNSAYAFAAASCGPDAPEALLSRNKNATIKIGGTINTRYWFKDYKTDTATGRWGQMQTNKTIQQQVVDNTGTPIANTFVTVANPNYLKAPWLSMDDPVFNPTGAYLAKQRVNHRRTGDFTNSDTNLYFDIQVNDNFDAYIQLNLLDAGEWGNVAQKAWIRWKNICNTGFGVLVGKNDLQFGEGVSTGVITPWTGGGGAEIGGYDSADAVAAVMGPMIGYDHSRTLQINPYWESQDGKFRFDLSFFEGIDWYSGGGSNYYIDSGNVRNQKSMNAGFGSGSAKIKIQPIEGLMLSASIVNSYLKNADSLVYDSNPGNFPGYNWDWAGTAWAGAIDGAGLFGPTGQPGKNNTAVDFAFKWTPCFMPKFSVWGQYVHNWNGGWIKDFDTDVANLGVSYDVIDNLTLFFQGDYLRAKNKNNARWHKEKGWALYGGMQYRLAYGVTAEVGYRYDKLDWKDAGGYNHTTIKGSTAYAHLGYDF